MKKRLFFVTSILLIGSMNVSAQVETVYNSKETQKQTPISIDEARVDYNQAKENLINARTGSRSSLSITQKELSDKKNRLLFLLESAINTETNKTVADELVNELNKLKSSN
jgi:hypothetical protein